MSNAKGAARFEIIPVENGFIVQEASAYRRPEVAADEVFVFPTFGETSAWLFRRYSEAFGEGDVRLGASIDSAEVEAVEDVIRNTWSWLYAKPITRAQLASAMVHMTHAPLGEALRLAAMEPQC